MERAAFEIVYENFRHRDTARVARASATPGMEDIIPLTALAAGVKGDPARRARMLVRMNGRDTIEIVQAAGLQADAAPYRIPARDTTLARWLTPEPLIQSHDARIAAQARQIIQRERSPARVAALLTHWVHSSVRRTIPAGQSAPSAVQVLQNKVGDCNEFTTLYVALARSAGLPARTVSGLLYLNGRFYYHAWPEIYLNDWIAVDPSFDQFPADAAHVRLVIGGLARQVELIPRIGRLKLEVL
jgi:transglutaminase-like putative cysteine protease